MRWPHHPGVRRGLTFVVATLALVGAGCGSVTPTPAGTNVLHVENRTATAVVLSIGSRGSGPDDKGFEVIVAPCGGQVNGRPGVDGMPATDWLIFLLVDPTGNLERELEAVGGDPSLVPDLSSGMEIAWSTGEINGPDLPRSITVTSAGVTVTGQPDPSPIPNPCVPWTGVSETPDP
jgi:hypothetical protein